MRRANSSWLQDESKEVTDLLSTITNNFHTISDLLSHKTLVTDTKEACKKWLLKPLFDDDQCSVGIVLIKDRSAGPCEEHVHHNSVEYLIVVRGSMMLNMNGKNIRALKPGDCAAIPADVPHYSTPLEDNTEHIYVTVPKDKDIPSFRNVNIVEDLDKGF